MTRAIPVGERPHGAVRAAVFAAALATAACFGAAATFAETPAQAAETALPTGAR